MKNIVIVSEQIIINILCLILCVTFAAIPATKKESQGIFKPPTWDAKDCATAIKEYGEDACFSCEDPYFGFEKKFNKDRIIRPPNFKSKRWLQIVIGTIPRKNNLAYLARTVRALRDQLPHPNTRDPFSNGAAHVKVVNFRPKTHLVFNRIKKEFQLHEKGKDTFEFIEKDPVRCDPKLPRGWRYKPNLSPEIRPRQQTRDVISLLLASSYDECENMLILEDDFELCPQGMHMIKFAILRADQRGWSTIRVGVGMSGIVIKCAEIPPFIHYLMTNQNMMPVDLLFTEYFSAVNRQGRRQFGDPRRNVNPFRVLQYNMLEHLGKQSTFSGRGQRHVGNCGSKLKVNSWMKQETFQQKCAMAGMSPCEAGVGTFGALVQYGYHRGTQRSLPGHIEILVGTKGLSCDEVCSNTDKSKCASEGFQYLNDCSRITSLIDCPAGCKTHTKYSNKGYTPALILQESQEKEEGFCIHDNPGGGKKSDCSDKSPEASRICPCVPGAYNTEPTKQKKQHQRL